MREDIERLAASLALCDARLAQIGIPACLYENMEPEMQERYRKRVQCVLFELREPTDKMIEVGRTEDSLSWSLEPGEGRDYDPTAEMFVAMIDHILDESR